MSIEIFGVIAGILGISAYAPQVFKVIKTKQTRDLSLGMWSIAVLALIFWIIYGVLKQSPTLVLTNGILLVMALTILIYKLRYH